VRRFAEDIGALGYVENINPPEEDNFEPRHVSTTYFFAPENDGDMVLAKLKYS
jgi:hypothetical protein